MMGTGFPAWAGKRTMALIEPKPTACTVQIIRSLYSCRWVLAGRRACRPVGRTVGVHRISLRQWWRRGLWVWVLRGMRAGQAPTWLQAGETAPSPAQADRILESLCLQPLVALASRLSTVPLYVIVARSMALFQLREALRLQQHLMWGVLALGQGLALVMRCATWVAVLCPARSMQAM